MRRFLIILLAIAFIFSLCAVPVSAASYDLGPARFFSYTTPSTATPNSFAFSSSYFWNVDDNEVIFNPRFLLDDRFSFGYNLDYYSDFTDPSSWEFLFNDFIRTGEVSRNIIVSGFDRTKPVLYFANTSDVSNRLYFPGFVYENLLLPMNGQYLRVSFSFSSALISAPQEILNLIAPGNLCFLCDTSGVAGVYGRYSYPKVMASTVTLNKSGNIYNYSFYFSLDTDTLEPLLESDNVCLAVRIPYFFNDATGFDGGVYIVSNADIPTTYEILTIGGYDQELAAIENAIITSNQQLIDIYTEQSSEDQNYVIQIKNSNSQLENSVDDYKNAASAVESIKNDFVMPPLNNSVKDNLEDLDPGDVKDFFSTPWIVSAIGLVFSFAIVRLILYGTKEG